MDKNSKVTINDGDYKEGDVIKEIKTVTNIGYGTDGFPKEELLETTFYFRLSAELGLANNPEECIFCTIGFTHEKELDEEGWNVIRTHHKTELAIKLGLKTISEMDRLIEDITEEEYNKEMKAEEG